MSNDRIYLDHNATTPVDPRVLDAMLPYFTEIYGNASSVDHEYGYEAKQAVDQAREQVAELINARPEEIIWTSGATEAINLALFGVAEKYADKGDHIITCQTEHKAVLDTCRRLEQLGKQITYLPVDRYGRIAPDDVRRAITPKTILISIMAANNEIGTIAPLAEIGAIAKEQGILFHSDAAQAFGHISLDVRTINVNLMSISAHKIYGPKGVGALYSQRGNPFVRLTPLIYGGGHERGVRSGTLNTPGIVGLGAAAKLCRLQSEETDRFRQMTSFMYEQLREKLGNVELNGHPTDRLPNNLNLYIKGVESKSLIVQLKDVAISTGSACTSLHVEPSHVLKALGHSDERIHQSVRLGVGRFTTQQQVEAASERMIQAVHVLRTLT